MAKQTPTIKNPSQQDAIAKAKAGKSMKSELAQGARKPLSQEELDKLNAKAVDAQQADIVADASATGSAQTAEAATIGSASEAGTAAGTISPLAIGAGVLGVVAIAAASGGSSGGSSSSNNQPLADGSKQNQNTQDQGKGTDTVTDGAAGGTGGTGAGTGGTGSAGAGGSGAGTGTTEPGKQDPVPPQYGQAIAEGTPKAPTVSPDGETKLSASKAAFAEKLAEAGKTEASQQFIRIDRILAAEGSEPEARLVRYPENDAQGVAVKPKAPDSAAAAPSQLTAYEVIKVEGGITLADAKAAAEKLGGKLMMVNDAAEAKWLDDAFKNFLGENTGAADLAKNGAWIGGHAVAGDGKFDAAIRAEGAQASKIHYFDHGAEKLNAFVVEFSNYQHPLTLKDKPVAEGQVINAEDFDKLVWNADGNTRGKISFSVVDSAEATEAGATKGDLVITESAAVTRPILNAGTGGNTTPDAGNNDTPADPNAGSGANNQAGNSGSTGGSAGSNSTPAKPLPVYPENNARTLSVTENKADAKLDKSVFTGTDEAKAPEFVKILTVDLPGLASDIGDKTALFITHSDRVENIANDTPEFILHKSLFDKISWNASLANGGSFTFVPVADDQGTAIPGAKAQTVTINETPAAPANPADGQQTPGSEQPVPGNEQQPGGQQNQDGGQQSQVPQYPSQREPIAVEHDQQKTLDASIFRGEVEGKQPQWVRIESIVNKNGEAAESGALLNGSQPLGVHSVIASEDFDKIKWDASKSDGGSFKFIVVTDKLGTGIADGVAEQTVTINEAEATPPAPKVPSYSGDAVTANVAHNKQDFNFANLKAQFEGNSDAVKATHIKITEIKKDASGTNADANTLKYKGQDVTDETVIAVAELNDLVWNAALAKGGSFKFTAVKEGGAAYENGPAAQSVTINEDAEPAPSYGSESLSAPVAHNQNLDFSSHAEHFKGSGNTKATHIKITEIKKDASGTDADDENTLKYNEQPVKENTVIDLAQLSKLVWDASKAVGGSFKFTPVKDNGDAYEASPAAQTVTINEAPYTAEGETQEVAKNAHTTLGKALFDFSVEDKAEPGFVKIVSLTPEANEMAGKFVVNETTKTAYQVVKVDAGITKANAIAAAEKMGGKLLEISDTTELGWIQEKTELMSKLTIDGAGTEGKGFWFANPSSGAVAGVTADKEGISVSSDAANTLKFSDATSDNADTGTLSGYVVEFSNYDADKLPSLMLDSGSQKDPVAQNDVIDFNDIKGDKLSWNSVFNNGGEVKFVEVTSKENATPVEGAVEKTITITEASAVIDPLLQNHVIL